MKPLVLYHGPTCLDGWTACWAAWKKFQDAADYRPVNYGKPPPAEAFADRPVFVLDFSYDPDVLVAMAAAGRQGVVVLDHHDSAEKKLAGLHADRLTVIFDQKESGASLAWGYFHSPLNLPWLVEYARDRDHWAWKLPDSREVSAYLHSVPWTTENWEDMNLWYAGSRKFQDAVSQGAGILRYQEQQVRRHAACATRVTVGDHRVLAVNATTLHSEIGERLAEQGDFGVTWFRRDDGKYVYSLRSRNGFDVSEVAKSFGGGGHKAAAGFETDEPLF